MAITILICVTGHLARGGVYNYLLSLPFLYPLCLQQNPQLVVVLYLWGDPDLHS